MPDAPDVPDLHVHHLLSLGFGPHFLRQLSPDELDDPPVGRVRFAAHGRVRLLTVHGEHPALLEGPLRDPHDPVVVGDWVRFRPGDPPIVEARLLRTGVLRRRDPDGGTQVVAANVDIALLCTALGRDLNPRRLERWIAVAEDAGADPVVVVTKVDGEADADAAVALVRGVTTADVVTVSAVADRGREALLALLPGGRTAALLGSSGVGKSTLLNWLIGAEAQATGAIRADERGRHTTTARHLLALPNGAWVIDNPGTRQVGPLDAGAVDAAFPDIDALASGCRFRDCGHADEPGCAVLAAVDAGGLASVRLAAWRKLRREVAWEARRDDPRAQAAERDRWKRIHEAVRRTRRESDRD